jgi:short-subunit dehydrogenase
VSWHQPKTILITGATGAIGGALAMLYAAPAVNLILFGRDTLKLEQLAEQCRSRGAGTILKICSLTDCPQFMLQLREACEQHCPDLVIANAGVSSTAGKHGESWQAIEEVVSVNLLATMATVQAVVPAMRRNGGGQIALISSLAAWYGLPVTPAYSASKAAIKNYGEALRAPLAADGIEVSVVLPGFVSSAMSRTVPGPKPFLMTADRAAQLIIKGLSKKQARISFPFPLNLGCWLLALLPASVSGWLVRKFGYHA